ncbi:DUF6807 family protein [Bacteroidota bacterium]
MKNISVCCRLLLIAIIFSFGCTTSKKPSLISVLILSGRNNHEWQKTTPVLYSMYNKTGIFITSITERPDTLTYDDYINYDVIVSNWNTWPDNKQRISKEQENAFEKYINEGGGAVFIHAGASSFYEWEAYHKTGIGRWGDSTSHGKPTIGKIISLNQDHPVTQGINEFFIMDEIWENSDIHSSAQALTSIIATDEEDNHLIEGPSVFINQVGKGQSFYTILGHDERAFFNTGFQTLIKRGTEWAASGDVSIEIPLELRENQISNEEIYTWNQTDTTIQLLKNMNLVWQYNFRNRFGKTYFHPIYLNHARITCESPVDHPWHVGLWFTWKFINNINYWEYMNEYKTEKTGYKSEGVTELENISFKNHPDYSADIELNIMYHPIGDVSVMKEQRNIHISPPGKDGSYYINYEHTFNAISEEVVLDRTPILGEPDGKSWGGYGGLSIRFNQDFTSSELFPFPGEEKYPRGAWLYMGLKSLTGEKVGVCMFQNPDYTTEYTRWYYQDNSDIPFFWFGPAALYDHKIILKKEEPLTLKYRVMILPGEKKDELEEAYHHYIYE